METHEVFNIFSGLGPSLVSNQHGHLSQIGMSMVAEGDASLKLSPIRKSRFIRPGTLSNFQSTWTMSQIGMSTVAESKASLLLSPHLKSTRVKTQELI